MQRVEVETFMDGGGESQIVDVRSPSEYNKGHIPGAINIPIFDDLERARVGTVYKKQSREEAIKVGLEIVGPKLTEFTNKAQKVAKNNSIYTYCWRGGMRSEKMAWLFELVGIETTVLEGGYKNYRKYGETLIESFKNYIVLQGPTGSGKTEILHELINQGEQVIDLEGLAKHKGSAFGGLGQEDQPTTQQFQNDIFNVLGGFDLSKPVWIESESATIGRVYLPEKLWEKMNSARIIAIYVPREERIKNIIEQYGRFSDQELSDKVENIAQKLGGDSVKKVVAFIDDGDLTSAVDILLYYYDKSYSFSAETHKVNIPLKVNLSSVDPIENARIIKNSVEITV